MAVEKGHYLHLMRCLLLRALTWYPLEQFRENKSTLED